MIKKLIFIILLSLFPVISSFATIYYVNTSCDAGGDGTSTDCDGGADDAWNGVADVNAKDFSNGDEIHFNKGDTFNDTYLSFAGVTSASGKTITIDSYGSGALPWLGGTSEYAILINHNHTNQNDISLVIQNILIDSQEGPGSTKADSYSKVYIRFVTNLTLDNVNGDGSISWLSDGKQAIYIANADGAVVVKNSEIKCWGGDPADLCSGSPTPTATGYDYHALSIVSMSSGSVDVYDNDFHGVDADTLYLGDLDGITINVYDNLLYNAGENSIDIKGCGATALNIYRNTIYRDASFIGIGGSSTGESGDSLMASLVQVLTTTESSYGATTNVWMYSNLIGPTDLFNFRSVSVLSSTDVNNNINIYYNHFLAPNKGHILLGDYSNNINVYYNFFDEVGSGGRFIWDSNNNTTITDDPEFYGNIFYNNSSVGTFNYQSAYPGMINIRDSANPIFRNNIFFINDSGNKILEMDSGNPVFSNNVWFNSNAGDDIIIDWSSTEYDESELAAWNAARGGSGFFESPDMNDPANDKFYLLTGAPGIDTGSNTPGATYDDAFRVSSAMPPSAKTTGLQGSFGAGWEIGAYIYDLVISNISPTDNGTNVNVDATVTWTNPTGATSVTVYFDSTDGTTQVATGSLDTSYDPGGMTVETEYFWKVNVVHAGGTEVGTVYSFTTSTGPPADPTKKASISYDSGGGSIEYDSGGMTIQ